MRKVLWRALVCTAVLGLFLMPAAVLAAGVVNTLRDAVLRDSPSFLGKVVETLGSGVSITVTSEDGAWAKVQAGGKDGWLPVSALRAGTVELGVGSSRAAVGAASSEVALAGKGFTQQSEDGYRASQSGLDYATVDMMAAFVVPPDDCETFLRTGREGGAR
jgi:uncharacterized protein YgiM (DUF1202 family)